MFTRRECIESIISNLNDENKVSRRNASRSLADYCRAILGEIGSHHSGYGIIKGSSIKHRFDLLCPLVPELLPYKKLFNTIQKIRDKVEHQDEFIPSSIRLQDLTDKVKNLDRYFETDIIPNLAKLGKIQEKYLKELEAVLELFYGIDGYPPWATGDLSSVRLKIEGFETLASRLNDVDNEVIQEMRLELRDLFNKLEILKTQTDRALEEASMEVSLGL